VIGWGCLSALRCMRALAHVSSNHSLRDVQLVWFAVDRRGSVRSRQLSPARGYDHAVRDNLARTSPHSTTGPTPCSARCTAASWTPMDKHYVRTLQLACAIHYERPDVMLSALCRGQLHINGETLRAHVAARTCVVQHTAHSTYVYESTMHKR
jgi:hypothetical protein